MSLIGMNLTDVGPDGESDPLTEVILELAVAAAKVAASPVDLVAGRVSLAALRAGVADELTYFPQLLDALDHLLSSALTEVGDL